VNEQEWKTSTDPVAMLKVVGKRKLDPRLRRFAVECCRRVRHLITEAEFQAAADAGEAFADDPRNQKSTIKLMAQAAIHGWRHRYRYGASFGPHKLRAADSALATCGSTNWGAALSVWRPAAQAVNRLDAERCDPAELLHQAGLLRCIFGNPFRPTPTIDPAWLAWNDGTVRRIAENIYQQHRFQDLPILADALEDAGCAEQSLLEHLRGEGPHCRGCWGLDLVLGKG